MELSIRAYAKHRGISDAAVRKAIKQGRISKNKNDKINKERADKDWEDNTNPAQIPQDLANNPKNKSIFEGKDQEKKVKASNLGVNNNEVGVGPTYHQSRAIKEAYNARLTKLQFEKESKKLISIDVVKIKAFNAARITRDKILNIPNRVIPQLVGKTNIHEMQEILRLELNKALEDLSNTPNDYEQ